MEDAGLGVTEVTVSTIERMYNSITSDHSPIEVNNTKLLKNSTKWITSFKVSVVLKKTY